MSARDLPAATSCGRRLPLAVLLLAPGACHAGPQLPPELFAEQPEVDQSWHRGPQVFVSSAGPARFVKPLHEAFDRKRTLELVRFIDGHYRAPANPAYDLVLERVASELRQAGFGGDDPRLLLDFLSDAETVRAWTPKRAELVLVEPGTSPRTLHRFAEPGDVDRVMLPINAPSCDAAGPVVLQLNDLQRGDVLVTQVPLAQVLERAIARGAVGVVSASIGTYNADPSGLERHLDAVQYLRLREPPAIPVMQISPRTYRTIEQASQRLEGSRRRVELQLRAEVEFEERPLRTLVATVVGAERPDEAVALVSHVQEPGACDNATGVAGLLESARSLADLARSGALPWPSRSLVFLWGDEFRQSEHWLDCGKRRTVAGFSSDMTGQSKETGAIALLERMPDPGALVPLFPDEHTPWGAGEVDKETLAPNGLAIIARCALVDVGLQDGGWSSADHPWEGGSDHDVFIQRGIPAALFWHFTDFTYHTSLDRLEFVDPDEMRRTGVALLASALAVADPRPTDLDRYLRSLNLEERVRVEAAEQAGVEGLGEDWRAWCFGAREWLRNLCLGIEEPLPR